MRPGVASRDAAVAGAPFHACLDRIASRRRRIAWLAFAGWASGAAGVGLALARALAAFGAPAMAAVGGVGGGALLIAAWALGPRRWSRWARSRAALAAVVDRHAGGDAALCAVELDEALRAGAIEDPWTRARVERHLGRVDAEVLRIDPTALVPATPAERAAGVAPIVLCVAAALWVVWPPGPPAPVASPAAAATDGEPAPGLQLRDVEVTLLPPPYTGEPPEQLPGGSGAFAALPGTEVTVLAAVDAPASAVAFQVGDGPWQQGRVVDARRIEVAFVVAGEPSYRIRVHGVDGDEVLETAPLAIRPRVDQPPRIAWLEAPDVDLEVLPGASIEARLDAHDDYGLVAIDEVLEHDGREIARRALTRHEPPRPSSRIAARWLAPEDPALAGARLTLSYEARDNDSVRGPGTTRTLPVRVHLLSGADLSGRSLEARAALLDALLRTLGEHLLWQRQRSDGAADADEPIDRAAEARAGVALAADAARVAMEGDPALDELGYASLGSTIDELMTAGELLRQVVQRARRDGGATAWAAVDGPLADAVVALERAALLVDRQLEGARWAAVHAAAEEAGRAMAALEGALASGDADAIDAAVAALQRAMAALEAKLATLDRPGAAELANAGDAALSPDLMRQLRAMIAAGKTDEAAALLGRSAAELAQLQPPDGSAADGIDAAAALALLDRAIAQSAALTAAQDDLGGRIDQLAEAHPGAAAPAALGEVADTVAGLRSAVERIAEDPAGLRLLGVVAGRTSRARRFLDDAADALEIGDLDRALRGVARAESELMDLVELAQIVERADRGGTDAAFADWLEHVDQTEREHARTMEALLQVEREWRAERSDAAAAAGPLVDAQAQRAAEAGALGELLEQPVAVWPGAAGQRRQLVMIGQLMGAAADDLSLGRLRRARAGGDEAVTQLQALERDLREVRERIEQGGSGGLAAGALAAASWPRMSGNAGAPGEGGHVAVPDRAAADAHLEALRSEALQAATEDAPPRYRPLNDRYYEELVR